MGLIELDLYYDYNCPFVYRSALMLDSVRASGERDVKVGWRFFSLTQVNYRPQSAEDAWTVWGAAEAEHVRGRLAFKAAEAARRQGAFDSFHLALLHARHRDRLDIESEEIVEQIAEASRLDLDRFREDVADPGILGALERDHLEGRARHGVFGTPTYVFPGGGASYVRLAQAPTGAEALSVFDRIVAVAKDEPTILEIKRPVRPTLD